METYIDVQGAADPRFAAVPTVFFVIGAQKAGTTWLSHYLKSHAQVSVPEWKEHDYWNMVQGRPHASRMLQAQARRRESPSVLRSVLGILPFTLYARRQRAITLALEAAAAPQAPYSAYADVILENARAGTKAAGEICPEYALLQAETYAKMAALSPNVRFVFLMRDPVSRFISGVRHSLRKRLGKQPISEEQLSKALLQYTVEGNRPLALSRYDVTISALEKAVPPENILYVYFEEMFAQDQVKRVCDFLGIDFIPGKIDDRANTAGSKAAPVRAQDRSTIAKALSPVYAFMLERAGDALPSKWRESAALC